MNLIKKVFPGITIQNISLIFDSSIKENASISNLADFIGLNTESDTISYHTEESFGEYIYFYLNSKNHIVFSKNIESVFSYALSEATDISMNKNLINAYVDTGFILPPFTIYNGVYILPQYTKIFFNDNNQLIIEYYLPRDNKDKRFKDINDFHASIQSVIDDITHLDNENVNIICTLSGGADSALILKYLSENNFHNLFSYTCNMPSAQNEGRKAKEISNLLGITNISFEYNDKDTRRQVDKFIKKIKLPLSDPIVPVFTSMFQELNNKQEFTGKKNIIIEGQSADTIFLGLPHNILINIYRSYFSLFFRFITRLIPNVKNKDSSFQRFFYRLAKLIDALGEKTWEQAFLKSLEHDKKSYEDYYQFLSEVLKNSVTLSDDRHHAVLLFFLHINQTREFQKYKLLPSNYFLVTPYLNANLISRSLNTPTEFFTHGLKKKEPIFTLIKRYFGKIIKDNQTLPFYVSYKFSPHDAESKNKNEEDGYLNLKRYSIISLENNLKDETQKNNNF